MLSNIFLKNIHLPHSNKLLTIGYASLTQYNFIQLLKKHQINAVVDVRSMPYSRLWRGFNREIIRDALQREHIQYVFLGDLCGAHMDDPEAYLNGVLNYEAVKKNKLFQKGLQRIQKGLQNYRPVLMCAEKDPISCHRFLLICRQLSGSVSISHIRHDASLETQADIEQRLLTVHQLKQASLFASEQERLQQAYAKQHQVIFGV